MPLIFLSPAANHTVSSPGGERKAGFANQIADEMEPRLRARKIDFTRGGINRSVGTAIRESNAGYYDLHLALGAFAPGPNMGKPGAAYFPFSRAGRCAAETLAGFYQQIYPAPETVQVVPSVKIPELAKTNAPAVLFCAGVGEQDSEWMETHITAIAENLTEAVCHCFGIWESPAVQVRLMGRVSCGPDGTSLYSASSGAARRLAQVPDHEPVSISEVLQGWYKISFGDSSGFVKAYDVLLL